MAHSVLGPHSISSLHGDHHKRIKRFISNALNSPESIRRIVLLLGKYIASFEAGPELDTLEQLIIGLSKGHRAHPRKVPGTTYYHALQ
ncbi:hypothetical protein Ancab_022807, partial [Ancistrocladus abbreviatus]